MKPYTCINIKDANIPVIVRNYKTSKYIKMYFKSNILYISKPKYVSLKKAMEFVDENMEEVYKLYTKINSNENFKIKKWVTGEKFTLKGQEYLIRTEGINTDKINLQIDNNKKIILIIYPKNLNENERKYNIDKEIKKFLKYSTDNYLKNKVLYWSKITNISYKQFKVNDATSKFGSCIPSKKVMHFSSRLIMLPEDKIDAVIVHELCHIVYPNHSKDFYNLVRKFIPNYDEINKWLKQNGKIIIF